MSNETTAKIPKSPTLKYSDITEKILHAFFKVVYPQLGYGFLEKVYENAIALTLHQMGLKAERQAMNLNF